MANRPRHLFHHKPRQEFHPELGSAEQDKFLESAQEFVADAYTGRDVTRPRELYTFLSLERVPTNLRSRDRQRLKSRSVNADARRVTFGEEKVIPRRSSFQGIPDSYFKFDISHIGLDPLPSISASGRRPSEAGSDSKPVTPFQHIVAEGLAQDIRNRIPISLVKGYHKVNLSTTYIFAPSERLDETLKYSTKVVLPKIKTSESDREEVIPPSVLTLDSVHNVESLHDKKFQVVNVVSPNKKPSMELSNHLFGVRPECVFLNAQLGEKNPFLRDHSKAAGDANVPRVVPGLHDLKDYAGYPKEYWKLRSEKISQPADLEADMIDRDLYRLRQLSNLKLNSIERTFPVNNDPFRKWRGKAGEPLFSPDQQRVPYRQRRHRYGPKSLSGAVGTTHKVQGFNPPLAVRITPLKITANDTIKEEEGEEEREGTEVNSRPKSNVFASHGAGIIPNLNINLGELNKAETTVTSTMMSGVDNTPCETAEGPQNTHTKLQDNKTQDEGNAGLGKITIQKQHELKKRCEPSKQPLKTAVVSVDLESLESLNTSRRLQPLTARQPALANEGPSDVHNADTSEGSQRSNGETQSKQTVNFSQKPVAHVMSLNFNPPGDFATPPSYPDAIFPVAGERNIQQQQQHDHSLVDNVAYSPDPRSHRRTTHPTPVESCSESVGSGAIRNIVGTTNYKPRALQLEVFGERKEESNRITIPTGRTSLHPEMPAYRLDLLNYPPLNPRQTCHGDSNRRSRSAGGRGGTPDLPQKPGSRHSLGSADHPDRLLRLAQVSTTDDATAPARRGGSAGPAVEIRFGQQGEVILSSSREKRGHLSSR